VSELPKCAFETLKDKLDRFSGDLATISDEFRLLLREVQRLHCLHQPPDNPDEYAMEAVYDDWQTFGFTEWMERLSSVERNVYVSLSEWANRFQRAVRLVSNSSTASDVLTVIENDQLVKLSNSIPESDDPRTGNELLRVMERLTQQSQVFTDRVDDWQMKQVKGRNRETHHSVEQLSADISQSDDSKDLSFKEDSWEVVKGNCYTAPAELALVYLQNPEIAAGDFLRILMALVEKYPGHAMHLMYPGLDFSETERRLGVSLKLREEFVLATRRFEQTMEYCRLEMPDLFGTVPSMENLGFMVGSSANQSQLCPEMLGSELEELEKSYVRFSGRFVFEKLRKGSKDAGMKVSPGPVDEEGHLEKGTNSTARKRTQKKGPGRKRKIAPRSLRIKVREMNKAGQTVDEIKKWLKEEKGITVSESVIYKETSLED
jgi:hypothetical protein